MSDLDDDYAATTQKGSRIDSAINIYYRATPITEILQDILGLSEIQTLNQRPELDTILVNLIAKSTSSEIAYRAESNRIVEDLQKIFNFDIKEEFRMVNSYILTVNDPKKIAKFNEPTIGGGMVQSTNDSLKIMRLSLEELSGFFQKKLKLFVLYDGNDLSKYNMELKKFSTVEELNKQLEEKYGLLLMPTESKVKFAEIY